jgi:hypothetical protein
VWTSIFVIVCVLTYPVSFLYRWLLIDAILNTRQLTRWFGILMCTWGMNYRCLLVLIFGQWHGQRPTRLQQRRIDKMRNFRIVSKFRFIAESTLITKRVGQHKGFAICTAHIYSIFPISNVSNSIFTANNISIVFTL